MLPPLINLVLIPSSHVCLMRNLASHALNLDMTSQLFPAQNWGRRLGRSPPRLSPVRNDPPVVHAATIVGVVVTLLVIAHHQSKRMKLPILPLRMMIHLLSLPMPVSDTITFFSLFTFPSACFRFRGYVRFWRIGTHGLYITLHNPIIVDFPRRLVATPSLLLIHSFGPFRAAPLPF